MPCVLPVFVAVLARADHTVDHTGPIDGSPSFLSARDKAAKTMPPVYCREQKTTQDTSMRMGQAMPV
jgi:hypothetical protein